MAPRRSGITTFLLGVLVLAIALACRFYYNDAFSFHDASGFMVFQVQGRSPPVRPPSNTELERLDYNLDQNGFPAGFVAPAPLGPKTEQLVPDREPNKPPLKMMLPENEVTAYRAPLYPLMRYGLHQALKEYAKYKDENPVMIPTGAVRTGQLILGSLTCVIYYMLTLRAFGGNRFLALLVGLATAAYPFWVINSAELEDGTLAAFLLAVSLWLGMRIGQRGGAISALLFGIALGGLALTRAAFLPFAVVLLLWLFIRCRKVSLGGLCSILAFLGFVGSLTPWTIRNYREFGKPIPIVTSAWLDIWAGNNPMADGSAYDKPMAERLKQTEPELHKKMAETPQADRYELLAPLVKKEILEQPRQTLYRRVRATMQFFLGVHALQGDGVAFFKRGTDNDSDLGVVFPEPWVRPLLITTLVAMYLLAILGWRWSYGWKRMSAPLALALFWIPLPYILTHAGPLHDSRLPMDGVFIVLAMVGLVGLIPGLGKSLMAGEQANT